MYLNGLQVSDFRNIGKISLELGGRHAAFIGPNGAGKTNLLESVYFALKGRPFRPFVQKEDLFPKSDLKAATGNLSIFVDLSEAGQRNTHLQVLGDPAKHRFSFSRNDKKISVSDLSFRFPVIAFSPQDHELVRGGPDVRRRFLDQVFADVCPGYHERSSLFEQALKQRNRLLKLVAEGTTSAFELKSWNQVFVERAFELYLLKKEIYPEFHHHFKEICSRMMNKFYQQIEVVWQTSLTTPEMLAKSLDDDFAKDVATKWTHSGPQRDDLVVSVAGQKSRAAASQGQGRLIGLLLRWTHAQWIQRARQEKALFLLDDFSSELDQQHREQLLESIFSASNQILWSATELPQNNLAADIFNQSKLFMISSGSCEIEKPVISAS